MAGSAMSDFMRRPGSSTRSSRRISSASAPPAMKASRHWLRAAAGTPYWRLVDCRSAPRSSSRTTLALRLADQRPLPPRPISRPAPVALRAPSRGPGIEGFVLDSFQSFYCKSVSDEIVLRGIRPRVVARGNDTAAALGEDRQVFADLAFDVLGRSEGQGDLVVQRAVKEDAVAELGGQSAVVHAAAVGSRGRRVRRRRRRWGNRSTEGIGGAGRRSRIPRVGATDRFRCRGRRRRGRGADQSLRRKCRGRPDRAVRG